MKTVHPLTIAVIILSSILLSACNAEPTPTEPVTFTILYNQDEATPFKADWLILQEYEKHKNVTFDVILGDDADYASALENVFLTGKSK